MAFLTDSLRFRGFWIYAVRYGRTILEEEAWLPKLLREANRANLLESIHKFGAMTQVELAEIMGVSTATISALVHQLVDEGQLETQGTVRNGRRAQLVTLAHHQGLAAGVHITRRGLRVVLCDDTRTPFADHYYPLPQRHLPDTTWTW